MAHARPFDFAPALERRPDAWRFLTGTPNIPAFYAARPGLEIINEVGIGAIRAKSVRQTARIIESAEGLGLRCTAPRDPERRGGTVAVDAPHGAAVSRALKARGILCDYRPGAGVRLSPHFYTSDAEVEAAVAELADIVASGAWRPFAEADPTVT
jgi:kynureninase